MKRTLLLTVLAMTIAGYARAGGQEQSPSGLARTIAAQTGLKLPASLTEEELEFLGSNTHRQHAAGGPIGPKSHMSEPARHAGRERSRVSNRHRYGRFMDQAWTVMLCKKGLIPRESARKVLAVLQKTQYGGEDRLRKLLKDEDLASIPVIGRTLQEPMARMQLREKQLDVIDATQDFLQVLLDASQKHADTIMPGMTHMAHSQPITYGAYLLSVHDGVYRGLEHLELAYKHTNENSGGCAATSGTGWPVDRYMITEFLGFDKLVEPTYDGEAGQDYAMNTLFALSNIMITLSRTAMDHGIWGMDGYRTHTVAAGHLGVSSLMPQKAHSGSAYERVRISANNVIGAMNIGVLGLKGEPHADVLPSYQAAYRAPNSGAIGALCETEMTMVVFGDIIKTMNVDKEKLLQLTRDGWGCTPDLQERLIQKHGYGRRRAWRICAVMVRIARDHRKIKPCELTGAMLDEAALVAKQKPPKLATKELQEIFEPVRFIERHDNTGDPNPKETLRMIGIRRQQLADSRQTQKDRRARVEAGLAKLQAEIDAILGTNSNTR